MSEPVMMYGKPVMDTMLSSNWEKDTKAQLFIFANEEDPASTVYVRNKKKKCEEFGIPCEVIETASKSFEEVQTILHSCTADYNKANFVIFQKPMAKQLIPYESYFDEFLHGYPEMDIDAFDGDLSTEFKTPATPLGIIKMLDYYVGLDKLDGMNAVVIGRSKIVGKPMADLLLKYNCTVTICHSHTKDLSLYTKNADLIVSAVGKAKFLTEDYIGDNKPIVVDVGINRDENGKLCGDVDFESVAPKCSFISPVPKGVGVLTVASLVYKMGENIE